VIRVLIVDDHKVVRHGLRFLLEQEDGIEVVGDCPPTRRQA
jgi:NarL family two-component system response regulator LiaR